MLDSIKRTFVEARRDNVTGEAAKVAFYLFLSLFPLILVIFSLTGLVGGAAAFRWITGWLATAVPQETAQFLEQYIRQVTNSREPGVLSFGLLLTLWAASGGVAALADGLNAMYDVDETRSWWKKRAIALGLLLAASVLLVGGTVAILAGPGIIEALGLPAVWHILSWPLAFALLVGLLWLVYYALPNRDQSGAKGAALAGAAVGAGLWLLATAGFRIYIANFGSYAETYGFVGAIIVLMLWLYLTAAVILFGGEVAAMVEAGGRASDRQQMRRAA